MSGPAEVQAQRLTVVRATLLRDVDRIWGDRFDPTDPQGSIARINPLVAARVAVAQTQGLAAAGLYATRVLLAAFAAAAIRVFVPADLLVGVDRYGRDVVTMLAGGPAMYLSRTASGIPPDDAVAAERAFQSRLAGSIVHDTARTFLTGLADPDSGWSHPQVGGWARIAHEGACEFCVMLAGRGYAYTSQETAAAAADGSRYHDRCRCTVGIGPAGTRDPGAEAHYRAWADAGGRTRWGAGRTGPRAGR